jgi:DNA adenine methylase
MRYLGSKRRIAKDLLLAMKANNRPSEQWWVEPFVGSASVSKNVVGRRLLSDSNKYIIALHQAIQQGWTPPTEVTREQYLEIKNNREAFAPQLVGFVMFACSFGGKAFGGFAKNDSRNSYVTQGTNSLLKSKPVLEGAVFLACDYSDLDLPPKSLVYCDPPYQNTTGYGMKFDSAKFFDCARAWTRQGHEVFVSEYSAPADFELVWERGLDCPLTRNESTRVERLFRVRS